MGPEYKERELLALRRDMVSFRSVPAPERLQAPPRLFKMEAQLESLFKRYRFKADVYDDAQLEEITFSKFKDLQKRLANHEMRGITHRAFIVVQRARRIVKRILADFDPIPTDSDCRFSNRATVGNPASDAYLDHKLADPITGSPEHIKWFKSHLRNAGYLRDVLTKCSPLGTAMLEVCESLPLVGVPKSYKSLRLIQPNTLIGSYYTYGLGRILVAALKQEGLDIRKLQNIHKRLACDASKHRKLVTADMSSASESFLWSLICRLLPRKWLRAVNRGRIRYFTQSGHRYNYCSFMAMGIGFTFPLQTLLFYAIVKACCELGNVRGRVSVYGDDLIYPTDAHRYISAVLQDVGMTFNKDKTFVGSNFRESCGGDYYHGLDVRPFSPEGSHQLKGPKQYEAWLYQIANGLRERWCDEEIPITRRTILLEILRVTKLARQVPPSFPDYSGLRCECPATSVFSGMMPVLCRFNHGSREYIVSHLSLTPQHRYVSFEEPYIYDWFRSRAAGEIEEDPQLPVLGEDFRGWLTMVRRKEQIKEMKEWLKSPRESLKLHVLPKQPKRYRSMDGRRLKRCIATTPCKLQPLKIQTNETGSISDWI